MTSWLRASAQAAVTPLAILATMAAVQAAWVSRGLLKELMSRPPVAANARPALDTARLESCVHTARNLDRTGLSLDNQLIVIQDTSARIDYLRRSLEGPQLPRPGLTEKESRIAFERHVAARDEMQGLLDRDMKAYRSQLAVYDHDVKAFERDCAGSFRKDDLETVRAGLRAE
jgi:hypothetical protein